MTRPGLTLAALLVGALPVLAQWEPAVSMPTPEDQPTLEELQWVARPFVVFADTENDPRFVQQMRELETRPGDLEERLVVVLTDTDPQANGPLRQRLRPRGFGIVLIDLDGQIATRSPDIVTLRELTNMIDRMPSRRQESGSRRP